MAMESHKTKTMFDLIVHEERLRDLEKRSKIIRNSK